MPVRDASTSDSVTPARDAALELVDAWRKAGDDWLKWWTRSVPPAPAARTPEADAAGVNPVACPAIPPEQFAAITGAYQQRLAMLWQALATTPAGKPVPQIVPVPASDRRFSAKAWQASPFHAWVLQAYLLQAGYLEALADHSVLPPAEHRRLRFAIRQYVDALAPTNFPATNPEVLERALATDGGSLVAGAANLAGDIARGRISMCDNNAFEVGRNVAVTPGSVVFTNDLIELIQYHPSTPTVHACPLVVIPPCINKYYILDLSPSNSFVRHAVAQGHTTFIVSWRNIPPELGHLGWDDYLERGVLQAIRVAGEIGRSRTVNALGFCVGGTLLACALAVLAARGDKSVASATLLTTMLDFEDPGEIGVYVTPEFLAAREPALLAGQRLRGAELATAFATLRANDLIWSYVVNNYLKGDTPPAFDLLFWNGDSANLPGPMAAFYLRELYLSNRLRDPGALTMLGERIDLGRIDIPAYVLATRDDHIVPWRSAFSTTRLLGGDCAFTLGASGHIAGVVNPPDPPKRGHWVNRRSADVPDRWLEHADSVAGSWWPEWSAWLAPHAGVRRKAPAQPGSADFAPLYPAPGRYVIERVA